jgi:hypothetical protein
MNMHEIRDAGQALAYVTDCTLATVLDLAALTRPRKHELMRQIRIAQKSIEWMEQFGVDYSRTRAAEVKQMGGSVEQWAEQFKPKKA